MSMTELFSKDAKAIDEYNAAVGMDFPQNFINQLDRKMETYLEEIENRGLTADFEEFSNI